MIEPIQDPLAPTPVSYQVLTPEEIKRVKPIFDERKVAMPQGGIFIGAIENGRVIGFLVLQLKLHAEPMWIAPGKSQIFPSLVATAENYILQNSGPTYVYLFAPEGRVSEMAEAMGMTHNSEQIWYKLLGNIPPRPFVGLQPIATEKLASFTLEELEASYQAAKALEAAYQAANAGHDDPRARLVNNPFDDSLIPETIQ
jgi:hypothetical protein